MHTWPCEMTPLVFNSPVQYDDSSDDEDHWIFRNPVSNPISFRALEVSPTSVAEIVEDEDAFKITTEWIENYLIPEFKAGKMVSKSIIKKIIREAKFNFACEDTIEYIYAPHAGKMIIVGDIHGQFDSTLTIFEDHGYPSQSTAYLFNGDIVDRGDKSLECILMVFAYKIALFGQFYVSRGNHESLSVKEGTFYEECKTRLADYPDAFVDFHEAFDSLPYGYVVEDKYFVTHGGIGPGMDLEDLRYLFRTEHNYRNHYYLNAMLWFDPCEDTVPVNEHLLAENVRGKTCMKFHPILTKIFLDEHNLKLLIRSHEMVSNGFRSSQFNLCLTIFSAPNYVNRGNKGAVVVVTEEEIWIQQMK